MIVIAFLKPFLAPAIPCFSRPSITSSKAFSNATSASPFVSSYGRIFRRSSSNTSIIGRANAILAADKMFILKPGCISWESASSLVSIGTSAYPASSKAFLNKAP